MNTNTLYRFIKRRSRRKEIELIKEWKTLYNQNGYNLKIGGSRMLTEDTIRKMSLAKKKHLI